MQEVYSFCERKVYRSKRPKVKAFVPHPVDMFQRQKKRQLLRLAYVQAQERVHKVKPDKYQPQMAMHLTWIEARPYIIPFGQAMQTTGLRLHPWRKVRLPLVRKAVQQMGEQLNEGPLRVQRQPHMLYKKQATTKPGYKFGNRLTRKHINVQKSLHISLVTTSNLSTYLMTVLKSPNRKYSYLHYPLLPQYHL